MFHLPRARSDTCMALIYDGPFKAAIFHDKRLHGRAFLGMSPDSRAQSGRRQKVQTKMLTYANSLSDDSSPEAVPIVVVGGGRIGRALVQMSHGRAKLLRRGEMLESLQGELPSEGPILVATHNCDLEAVLRQVPESRWRDLVWLQGGMLLPWLLSHGLAGTTQAVLYIAASPKDPSNPQSPIDIVDGAGKSVVCGKWGSVFSSLLQSGGVRCSLVDEAALRSAIAEKLLWASIFWLLCKAHGVPCGVVATLHRQDVYDLTFELVPLLKDCMRAGHPQAMDEEPVLDAQSSFKVQDLKDDSNNVEENKWKERSCGGLPVEGLTDIERLVDSLCSYSIAIESAVPSVAMAVNEFEWRNGWFLKQASTPLHLYWLKKVGLQDMLPKEALKYGRS